MRRAAAVLLAVASAAAAGCGAERTPVADLDNPQQVFGHRVQAFPRLGVTLRVPDGWQLGEGRPPLLTTTSSGPVTISVWRYPRREPLPEDDAELADARRSVLLAARARDRTLEVTASQATEVDGRPAVLVRARGDVDGRRRELRSAHVYAFGAEVVIDGFAPRRHVGVLEREHDALVRSLELRAP